MSAHHRLWVNVSRETSVDHELLPVPGASFAEIAIDQIVPNTKQPREVFDEDDLKELSASIKEVGVLQPVVVRSIPREGPLREAHRVPRRETRSALRTDHG